MKYKCSICGYEYDEAKEGIAFAELPDSWQCPWCGAPKSAFEPVEQGSTEVAATVQDSESDELVNSDTQEFKTYETQLSIGQMAALCSNLARGCEKQYMPEEQRLFNELAEWFTSHSPKVEDATVEAIAAQLQQNLTDYPQANQTCVAEADRGAQRALGWSEKATRMLNSLMSRYQKEGDVLLADNEIWVCSVCGFVYIGKEAPELCPVCKVPAWKFNQIGRRNQS